MLLIKKGTDLSKENLGLGFKEVNLEAKETIKPVKWVLSGNSLSVVDADKESSETVLINYNFFVKYEKMELRVSFLKDKTPIVYIKNPNGVVDINPLDLGIETLGTEVMTLSMDVHSLEYGDIEDYHLFKVKELYKLLKGFTDLTEEEMLNSVFSLEVSHKNFQNISNIQLVHTFGQEHFLEQYAQEEMEKREKEEKLRIIREQQREEIKAQMDLAKQLESVIPDMSLSKKKKTKKDEDTNSVDFEQGVGYSGVGDLIADLLR